MKLSNVKTLKPEEMEKQVKQIMADQALSKSGKMKKLFGLGMEIKEIAIKMGVRYNFVYNVISNEVITKSLEITNTKTITKRDEVKTLMKQNKTCKEIASELKTNMNYIYKLMKEIKAEEKPIEGAK